MSASLDTRRDLTGVVLAGGRASRMGCDKPLLVHAGCALYLRALDALRPNTHALLLAHGRRELPLPADVDAVCDEEEGRGPLAALGAVFATARTPRVLVLPADLPSVTADAVAAFRREASHAAASVLVREGRLQPLVGIYPVTALAAVRALRAAGEERMGAFAAHIGAVPIDAARLGREHADALTRDVDTPEEWRCVTGAR
jgi:molybdenum cofactor guanylyltransferase